MTHQAASPGSAPRLPAATSVVAALLAASCCLLPLGLIALGVVGAGFMMTMMRYEWLTLPLGIAGLGGAYVLYFRARQRCTADGCQFLGRRVNQVVLSLATVVVVIALLLRVFPT